MHISLIANARSPEQVERLRSAVAELRAAGHEVAPRLTFEAGDARRFAREAAAAGTSLLIVAGGDGTINEAANGIHDHLAAGGGERTVPSLAIVPLGTANDFASAMGIPADLDAALEVALGGTPVEIDVGLINGRCFLNVSTGGFGADATGAASPGAKRTLGTVAYLIEGIKRFAALQTGTARFSAGEPIYEGRFLLFAVGNSRRTGGGNRLTPRAELHDDLLDVCIVKELSRVEFLGLLPDLRAGEHLDHPAVIYRQVPELSVEAEGELTVNADGEPLRDRRFHYTISPHRLRVVVSPTAPEAAG